MNVFVGQTFQMNQPISIKQGVGIVDVGCSNMYEMLHENSPYSNPTFPKQVKITQNRIG